MKTAFLDTNIFMQFVPIKDIDWLEQLACPSVVLVVSAVVLSELDEQKNQHPLKGMRDRVQRRLRDIEYWLTEVESDEVILRPEVRVVYFHSNALQEDVDRYGLNAHVKDDLLVASARRYQHENPRAEVVLVSADTGPRITARRIGLTAIEPSDEYRAKDVRDAQERELASLKAELERLKSQRPIIRLGFGEEGSPSSEATKSSVRVPSKQEVNAALRREKRRLPFRAEAISGPLPLPDIMASQYNPGLRRYFDDFESYLREEYGWREFSSRSLELQVYIQNSGTMPAEDVHAFLDFPDFVQVHTEDSVPEYPERPTPPDPANPFLSGVSLANTRIEAIPAGRATSDRSLHAEVRDRTVVVEIPRVKQNVPIQLPSVFVEFRAIDDMKNFRIDYRLQAANIPGLVRDVLNVRVNIPEGP